MKKEFQVILIDDDADDQQIFAEALKDALPEVDSCAISNDRELYSFFDSGTIPNLFFLDWSVLCEFDKNCLELIKQQKHLTKVPVIIYSGLHSDDDINKLYAEGAALFVNKPSSYRELTEILKMLLTINWDEFSVVQTGKELLSEFTAIKFPA